MKKGVGHYHHQVLRIIHLAEAVTIQFLKIVKCFFETITKSPYLVITDIIKNFLFNFSAHSVLRRQNSALSSSLSIPGSSQAHSQAERAVKMQPDHGPAACG